MESLELIVLENSANCNLRCELCPTVHATKYPREYMKMEVFEEICHNLSSKIFPKCALMGWGEPLQDPTYFGKLSMLKKGRYIVGSTTNLLLLNSQIARKLIDYGLDYLGISIDYNHLYFNPDGLEIVERKIEQLFEEIEKNGSSLKIGINIIILKNSISFFWELIEKFRKYPIKQFSVAPLIIIPSFEKHGELLKKSELKKIKRTANRKYKDLSIGFDYIDKSPTHNCRSDIFKNVYVDYNGEVSPCCMLAMEFPNITFEKNRLITKKISFGSLKNQEFQTIWNSPDYKRFRAFFESGNIPINCSCCNAWRDLP